MTTASRARAPVRRGDGTPDCTARTTSRQLVLEGRDGIAAAQLGTQHLAVLGEHGQGRGQHRLAADDGKVVEQRGLFQIDLEAVREGPALLGNHPAGRGDHQLRIVEAELGVEPLDHFAPHAAGTLHRPRQPAGESDEMGVVDVQIEHRAADHGGVVVARHPQGIGDDPLEVAALDAAVLAAGHGLVGEAVLGEEGQHVADHQHAARLVGRVDHGNSVGGRQGDRLLAKHVPAGREGLNRGGGVQRGGQADVDQVELRGRPASRPDRRTGPRRKDPSARPAGPKLPLIVRQSPPRRSGSCSQTAWTFTPGKRLVGQVMDHAHETETDDANVNHCRNSFPLFCRKWSRTCSAGIPWPASI